MKKSNVPVGESIEVTITGDGKPYKEIVKVLRIVSDQAKVMGKPAYEISVLRPSGKTAVMFPMKDARYNVVRQCLSCDGFVKSGAEHFGCAMKHPHLAAAGWFFWLIGARKAEEWVKNRVRLDVIRSHIGEFILARINGRDKTVKLVGIDSGIICLNGKPVVELWVEYKGANGKYRINVFKNVTKSLRTVKPPRRWD